MSNTSKEQIASKFLTRKYTFETVLTFFNIIKKLSQLKVKKY